MAPFVVWYEAYSVHRENELNSILDEFVSTQKKCVAQGLQSSFPNGRCYLQPRCLAKSNLQWMYHSCCPMRLFTHCIVLGNFRWLWCPKGGLDGKCFNAKFHLQLVSWFKPPAVWSFYDWAPKQSEYFAILEPLSHLSCMAGSPMLSENGNVWQYHGWWLK